MNELLLIALANFGLCAISWFICVCRLNAMRRLEVRMSVKIEYALGAAVMLFSAGRPLVGEWPGYASLAVAAAYLWSMLASSPAWKDDTPPDVALKGFITWNYLKLKLIFLIERWEKCLRSWIQKSRG